MLNLDISVRLMDGLTKPARDATGALDKLAAAATRLTNRFAAPTRAVRGLATALQGLKAADGAAGVATASTGRLRGSMAAIGPAARTASTGLDRFGRAADRLAGSADKAATSTRQLHAALAASLPAGGFLAGAETQLRNMLSLQRQALAGMGRLNTGGGGRGRSGMGGGNGGSGGVNGGGSGGSHGGIALAYDAPGLMSFSRKAIADTEDAENALTQVRLTGMAPKDVDRIKALAQRVAAENPLTTYAENLRGILEARTALSGDLNEAMQLFPKATQYAAIFAHSGGVSGDQVKAAKDSIYQALRAGELRNVANDPARLDSLLSGIMGANIASDGRITPKMFASNIQYARSAGLSLSDKFTNLTLPFLMGELQNGGRGAHGGQAGNALMSAYSTIVQGRIAKASLPEWEAAGQLDKKDVDDKGHVRPGAIKGTEKFMNDPRAFVADLMANFESRGIKSQTAILEHLSAMFGNRTAAGLMDLIALQESRIEGFSEMTKMAGAGDPRAAGAKFAMIQNELSTATAGLSHSFGLLRTTAIAPFIPALTSATRGLTSMTTAAQGFLSKMLGAANDPNDPNRHALGFGEIATLAGGAAWLGAKLVTKAPGAATLLGQAAIASQAGPVAGFLSRATVKATVEAISGALTSGIGLGLTRVLGKGVLGGLIYEAGTFAIDKLIDALPKPHFTDDQKRYAAADIEEMKGAWPWQVPGLLWRDLTHDRASDRLRREDAETRRPAPADVRGMMKGPQLDLPPVVVPFGGARALGGQVRGGMAYLVGEHGPEILQANTTGSVATASRTARMLGQLGEAGGNSEDHDTASSRAIRALGFTLAASLEGVERAIDRLGHGRIMTGLDPAGGGGGGGGGDTLAPSDAGGGGGGRRGMMGRMPGGHFGGRRGLGLGGGGTPLSGDRSGFGGGYKDNPAIHDYIVASAKARGINPAVALKVWGHEGHAGYVGDEKSSFGPFQLHYGGISRSMPHAGMGDDFTKATGLDARDPTTIRQQVDFAMNHVRRHGWGAWMGAKAEGITGFRGVGPMPGGDPGMSKDRTPLAGLDGKSRAGVAGMLVEKATSMLGFNDQQAAHALGKNMHAGAWCADFVNGMLQSKGMKGSSSAMANSFFRWGQHVDPNAAKSGDVLVSGHHVGFARGPAEMHNGRMAYPMISGNYGHRVANGWADARQYEARRSAEGGAIPPAIADASRVKGERERVADTRSKTGGTAMHVGTVHVHVAAQPHHDAKQVAELVHKRFNDAVHSQLNDGAYG